VHSDAHVECEDSKIRHGRWKVLVDRVGKCGLFMSLENSTALAVCVAKMGSRGKRIVGAAKLDELGRNLKLWKTVTLKYNETLPLKLMKTSEGMCMTLKPRAITNLDPIFHARCLPWARAIADYLHMIFDGRPWNMEGVVVRVHFASGYYHEKLNKLGEDLTSGDTVIGVAGDDSAVSWGELWKHFGGMWGEADQSAFDHTQDDGPQRVAALVWMRALGIPDEIIDLFYHCCCAPYVIKTDRLEVRGEAGTQMPTGTSVTTAQSSLNTIFFYFWTIFRVVVDKVPLTVAETARELGFKTKYVMRNSFGQVTFLKGWWRKRMDGSLCWTPLPSACLKLGKTMTNHTEIFRPSRTQSAKGNPVVTVRQMASAMASSYGQIDSSYPILGVYLQTLRRLGWAGRPVDRQFILEGAEYKTVVTTGQLDRDEALQAVSERYGLTVADVSRVETLLQRVSCLPAYVEDPAFQRLQDLDYC